MKAKFFAEIVISVTYNLIHGLRIGLSRAAKLCIKYDLMTKSHIIEPEGLTQRIPEL
jgi:hypothetical protein